MKIFWIILIVLTFGVPFWSHAQDSRQEKKKDSLSIFKDFRKNNTEFDTLLKIRGEYLFRLTYPKCTENVNYRRLDPTILQKPVSGYTPLTEEEKEAIEKKKEQDDKDNEESSKEDKKERTPIIIDGQWIEHFIIQACNLKARINQLAVAYKTSSIPSIYPLTNGKTALDPIDQPFAEQAIKDRLIKLPKPCTSNIFTVDSTLVGYRTPDGKAITKKDEGYGRFERWNIRACSENYTANILIRPDPKTRYSYIARIKQ